MNKNRHIIGELQELFANNDFSKAVNSISTIMDSMIAADLMYHPYHFKMYRLRHFEMYRVYHNKMYHLYHFEMYHPPLLTSAS